MTLISSHTLTKPIAKHIITYICEIFNENHASVAFAPKEKSFCRKFHFEEGKLTNDLPLKEQPRKNVKDYGNLLVSHLFVIIGA
jgi:hypothetical protein